LDVLSAIAEALLDLDRERVGVAGDDATIRAVATARFELDPE